MGKDICTLWNQESDGRGVFRYDYLSDRKIGRFTIVTSTTFAAKILNVLNGNANT